MHNETNVQPAFRFLDGTLRALGLCFCLFTVWLWPVLIVWLVSRGFRRSRSRLGIVNAPPTIMPPPPLPPVIPPPLPPIIGYDGGESPADEDVQSFAA